MPILSTPAPRKKHAKKTKIDIEKRKDDENKKYISEKMIFHDASFFTSSDQKFVEENEQYLKTLKHKKKLEKLTRNYKTAKTPPYHPLRVLNRMR